MHPAPPFQWTDRSEMRAFVAQIGLGSLSITTPDGPRSAIVPVLWEGEDALLLHLSRANALLPFAEGAQACFTVIGPHAYISPLWYGLDDQVPTWDYVAVELAGRLEPLNEAALLAQVAGMSDHYEASQAEGARWSLDQLSDARREALLRGIAGFRLVITDWRGTRKLGQHKPAEVRARVAEALEAAGESDFATLARAEPGR